MEYLYEIGYNDEQIKNMIDINNDLLNVKKDKIIVLTRLLSNIGCNENQIRNIIESNPLYLSRSVSDIEKLISKLESLKITNLETTFDSNPWLLNKDAFEIDDYINERLNLGISMDDIIDEIDFGMID